MRKLNGHKDDDDEYSSLPRVVQLFRDTECEFDCSGRRIKSIWFATIVQVNEGERRSMGLLDLVHLLEESLQNGFVISSLVWASREERKQSKEWFEYPVWRDKKKVFVILWQWRQEGLKPKEPDDWLRAKISDPSPSIPEGNSLQFSDAFKAVGVAVFAYYAENEDIDCHREMKRTQFGSRFIVEEQPSSVQKDQMDIIKKCVLRTEKEG